MDKFTPHNETKICVIGLGYVGLPLAVEFAKKYLTFGFDINPDRVKDLANGHDKTLEVPVEQLSGVLIDKSPNNAHFGLIVTSSNNEIASANFYIITVPTPINKFNQPDLGPLLGASKVVGQVLKQGDVIVYESTVYPGLTEEECVPILEKESGLVFNKDFFVGYSPERINPGDKEHTVSKILKVTSGSTPEVADYIDSIYNKIITAGTYKASNIKVAEAAKVIENAQRDINIAFVNELAMIFNKMGIDTLDVLEAAGTKWNFLPFWPGLVGGHCIGVDPYYLAQKAQEVGYHPDIILAGRRLNDRMGKYVATEVVKLMLQKDIKVKGSRILVLGITFKENCPDIRNTRVVDIIWELQTYEAQVEIFDPWASPMEVKNEYDIVSSQHLSNKLEEYSAVILAVGHTEFRTLLDNASDLQNLVIYDVKGFWGKRTGVRRL